MYARFLAISQQPCKIRGASISSNRHWNAGEITMSLSKALSPFPPISPIIGVIIGTSVIVHMPLIDLRIPKFARCRFAANFSYCASTTDSGIAVLYSVKCSINKLINNISCKTQTGILWHKQFWRFLQLSLDSWPSSSSSSSNVSCSFAGFKFHLLKDARAKLLLSACGGEENSETNPCCCPSAAASLCLG